MRPELWSEDIKEALSRAPRRFIIGDSDGLASALAFAGWPTSPISHELSDEDALIVPMHPLEELVLLVDRLLGPGGCPWDQAQTHVSLKKCLLEESYEVLDAIDSQDAEKLQEELGDLLLQPVMHGQIAVEFDTAGVCRAIIDKLIRRHPHVFGSITVSGEEEVLQNWDEIKKSEKGSQVESVLAGVPVGMASLLRAHEISKRAARQGFEWPDLASVWEKLEEETHELKQANTEAEIESEVGDLLFTVVNLARWYKVEPEEALRQMLNRFTKRFQDMEQLSPKELRDLSPDEWDALWESAKQNESKA